MSGDSLPGGSLSAVILTSSSAPLCAAGALAPLTTGERLAGTGRFFAAVFVCWVTGVSLSSPAAILSYGLEKWDPVFRIGHARNHPLPAGRYRLAGSRRLILACDAADAWPAEAADLFGQGMRPTGGPGNAVADFVGNDEERAEAALIAAAGKILGGERPEVPADFVAALFCYAEPEDRLRYDPRQVAELAADAWSFMAERPSGVPKVRLTAPGATPGRPRDSVLEILNDDMPFLVDSVLGELNERGVDIRFLVHPVFAVERD